MIKQVICVNTVVKEQVNILEVKKSKFIALVKRIDSELEAKQTVEECKKRYPMAKHYVYAYIIDDLKRCSDDKEPSKTAGAPILQVLEKKEMDHIICVVVRYFGGILLGAPGLVRAYTKSACNVLDMATKVPLILYKKVLCVFPYEFVNKMDFLLKDRTILEKNFLDKVSYTVLLEVEDKILTEIKGYSEVIE